MTSQSEKDNYRFTAVTLPDLTRLNSSTLGAINCAAATAAAAAPARLTHMAGVVYIADGRPSVV